MQSMKSSHLVNAIIGCTLCLMASCAIFSDSGGLSAEIAIAPLPATADVEVRSSQVEYLSDLDLLVFEQVLEGQAGQTIPSAAGQLDGAPVLAYVFPTTLKSEDVGFGTVEGIVALAITSHPDFDDTPLWDEDNDSQYDNDGTVFHSHWAVLTADERVPGGLAVSQFEETDDSVVMPPTNPGMPMYLDSPGFSVRLEGDRLSVLVPAQRVNNQTRFNYDAVTAYMQVNTTDESRPLLGVYEVYDVLSEDLSLPYSVENTAVAQ